MGAAAFWVTKRPSLTRPVSGSRAKALIMNGNLVIQARLPVVKPYVTAGLGTIITWGSDHIRHRHQVRGELWWGPQNKARRSGRHSYRCSWLFCLCCVRSDTEDWRGYCRRPVRFLGFFVSFTEPAVRNIDETAKITCSDRGSPRCLSVRRRHSGRPAPQSCDVSFESGLAGRRSAQPGAAKAAQYIFDQFRQAGFDVQMQEFSNNRRNVVARLGSVDRHILLGAHYDGQDGFPSASDNAAGVAVLIELARDLKAMNLPMSIVAVAFDDEEQGLNGSNFYVDHPIFPLEQTAAAAIFDTMGRHFLDLKRSTLFVMGTEYSRELMQIVNRRARPDMLVAGVDLIGPRSDFAGFARKKIPFLFFTHATHKDYHGAGDRPELLDYPRIAEDANIIELMIADIARLANNPVYLDQPVYQPREAETLLQLIGQVRQEKPDLPKAYQLVLADLEQRIKTDRRGRH